MQTELETRPVNLSDIALALGITKATVSYALSGKGRVAPSTRQRVLEVAQEMGFQPNPHAKTLSMGRASNTIALCFTLDLGVSARKLQVIQGLLMGQGYEIPAHALRSSTTSQIVRQTTDIVSTVCRQRPRAIISTELPAEALPALRHYQVQGGIVVCYDMPMSLDCDQVLFDRVHSGYVATKHLLELGHREIAYGFPGTPTPKGPYFDGYCRALKEYGLSVREEWLLSNDTHGFGGGIYEEAGAQLAQEYLARKCRPSAVCITDDYSVVAFAAALEEAGLSVPRDVSVVGCDDSPIARYGPLKVTTVTHPVQTIAEHVVECVRNRIETGDESPPRVVTLQGKLIVRASTAERKEASHAVDVLRQKSSLEQEKDGSKQSFAA